MSQNLHRLTDGSADNRLANPPYQFPKLPHNIKRPVAKRMHDLSSQHQPPCGGVHQWGGGMTEMLAPVRWRDLVADQRIHGDFVRHTQQRLGKAHQCNTFFRGQTVLAQKGFHDAGIICTAKVRDKPCGFIDYGLPGGIR